MMNQRQTIKIIAACLMLFHLIVKAESAADKNEGNLEVEFPEFKVLESFNQNKWTALKLPNDNKNIIGKEKFQKIKPRSADNTLPVNKKIEISGIPFELGNSVISDIFTDDAKKEFIEVDVPDSARNVFLLLMVKLPGKYPHYWSSQLFYQMKTTSSPDQLLCKLTLVDGSTEFAVPLDLSANKYQWTHGVGVYALRSSLSKGIKKITLYDKMNNAALGVIAVTCAPEDAVKSPRPDFPCYVLNEWEGTLEQFAHKPNQSSGQSVLSGDDGVMAFAIDVSKDIPCWTSLDIPPARTGNILTSVSKMWEAKVENTGQVAWKLKEAALNKNGFRIISVLNPTDGRSLEMTVEINWKETGGILLSSKMKNNGTHAEKITEFQAPILSNIAFNPLNDDDTWYWIPRTASLITDKSASYEDGYGVYHPLQIDGVFSPFLGWGIGFMTRDQKEGVFRYFCTGKNKSGYHYSQKYLPFTLKPEESRTFIPVLIKAMPGDWKAQFNWYKKWLAAWWKPEVAPRQWFKEVFSFVNIPPWDRPFTPPDKRLDDTWKANRYKKLLGALDLYFMYGWAACPPLNDDHDGSYEYGSSDNINSPYGVGGKERFRKSVEELQKQGIPVGLYVDGYLVNSKTENIFLKEKYPEWIMKDEKGHAIGHDWGRGFVGYMCLSCAGWQDYLVNKVYKRISDDIGPKCFYLDEYGKPSPGTFCWSNDHGHEAPFPTIPIQHTITKKIRNVLPDDVALFSEYTPTDIGAQYQDGAYGHTGQYYHSDPQVVPYALSLQRFAFPAFKRIELPSSSVNSAFINGNWAPFKAGFFNGDAIITTDYMLETSDQEGIAWIKNVLRILTTYKDAFSSSSVEPLVKTLIPGIYANCFEGKEYTVWTFYNANPFSVAGAVLELPGGNNITYYDAWNKSPVKPYLKGNKHLAGPRILPNDIGCLVRKTEKKQE